MTKWFSLALTGGICAGIIATATMVILEVKHIDEKQYEDVSSQIVIILDEAASVARSVQTEIDSPCTDKTKNILSRAAAKGPHVAEYGY